MHHTRTLALIVLLVTGFFAAAAAQPTGTPGPSDQQNDGSDPGQEEDGDAGGPPGFVAGLVDMVTPDFLGDLFRDLPVPDFVKNFFGGEDADDG